jgi:hypothetical protein
MTRLHASFSDDVILDKVREAVTAVGRCMSVLAFEGLHGDGARARRERGRVQADTEQRRHSVHAGPRKRDGQDARGGCGGIQREAKGVRGPDGVILWGVLRCVTHSQGSAKVPSTLDGLRLCPLSTMSIALSHLQPAPAASVQLLRIQAPRLRRPRPHPSRASSMHREF